MGWREELGVAWGRWRRGAGDGEEMAVRVVGVCLGVGEPVVHE